MDRLRTIFSPSRVATYLTGAAGIATAGAVYLQDQPEPATTAGLVTTYLGLAGVVFKWLDGRAKWEVAEVDAAKRVLATVESERRPAEAPPTQATDVPASAI